MVIKRQYYETAVAVMRAMMSALWAKEKCRIVIEYDPDKELVKINKEAEGKPCSQKEDQTVP